MTDPKFSHQSEDGRSEQAWKEALSADDCPPIEALLNLEGSGYAGAERLDLQRHLEGCPRCRSELEVFQDFERAEEKAGESADVDWIVGRLSGGAPPARREDSSARNRSAVTWGWKPLAALAAAAILAVMLLQWPSQDLPPLPEGAGGTVRSGRLTLQQPVDTVSDVASAWRWTPVEGARRYTIRVYEVDGKLLWEGESTAAQLSPPQELVDRLLPGKRVFWEVTAYDANGLVAATSERVPLMLLRIGNDHRQDGDSTPTRER